MTIEFCIIWFGSGPKPCSNIKDKGISFGENARGEISNLSFENSKLGVAVKDGSNLRLSNYEFKNNQFDVVVFNKKKEYEGAYLFINDSNDEGQLNYLIGFNNNIIQLHIIICNMCKKHVVKN